MTELSNKKPNILKQDYEARFLNSTEKMALYFEEKTRDLVMDKKALSFHSRSKIKVWFPHHHNYSYKVV
jgi:hypothetical protein